MKLIRTAVILGAALIATPSAAEDGLRKLPLQVEKDPNMGQPITKAEVRRLFDKWNKALKTRDPAVVANRYAREGVLLPMLSDEPRYDHEAIKDYFVEFLSKKPDGRILEGEIYVGNDWAQDAGIYEFTFRDGSKMKARYSFVYVYENGRWMISHHHSSVMPEQVMGSFP